MISTEIKEIKEVPGERIYYIYEYWRLDNNTCFYVGKGKGERCFRLDNRSKHFLNIINKVDVAVTIVADGLTEADALATESFIIDEYVMDEGYGIDIIGIKKNNTGCNLVNATWGGDGLSDPRSEETKKKISESKKGELNPNYGKTFSEEHKKKMSIAVVQLDKTTGAYIKTWDSAKDIDRAWGKVVHTSISACCKGKRKSCNGFLWMYEENYIDLISDDESLMEQYLKVNTEQLPEAV